MFVLTSVLERVYLCLHVCLRGCVCLCIHERGGGGGCA